MIDGRLLLPAGAAWAAAAVSLTLLGTIADIQERHERAVHLLILCLVVIAIVVFALWRWGNADWFPGAAATALGAGLGIFAATMQVYALTADPLAEWVSKRASVTVTGIVGDEPFTRINTSAAPWEGSYATTVRFATSAVEMRGEMLRVEVPMVIRVSDPALVPAPGSHVRVAGRLAPAGPMRHSAANLSVEGSFEVIALPGFVDTTAAAMRDALRTSAEGFAPDVGSLIAGLAIGDESGSPPALTEAMLGSGLSHLTAVSGGNVAIIVVIVLGITSLLRLPMPARVVITLIVLAWFVVLVRPQPSVLRAAVMGAVVLVGMLAGGRRAGPSVLATAVLALVILSPFLAVAWGFALSVAATCGLILIAPWCRRWIDSWPLTRRWPLPIRNGLAITSAAQLGTLPLLVAMGGAVGWVALPANLLAMPAVVPVTVFGLLAALIGTFVPALAVMSAFLAAPGAWWISRVASVTSSLPGAELPWPGGWIAAIALLALFAALWISRRYARIVVPLVLVVWVVWTLAPPDRRTWPPPNWLVVSCAVGQGDAHVINLGAGSAIVIDVGPDPTLMDTCLSDLGVTHLPAVVISHFHADHVNGLTGALGGRDVGAIISTPLAEPQEQFSAVDEWRGDIPLEFTRYGEIRNMGDVRWQTVWPMRIIDAGSRPNNTSAVLLVEISGYSFLFTGDIEPAAQSALLANLPVGGVDVVKVPHHGSRFQLPNFAARTSARIALISVGEGNTYGHPAAETLQAWEAIGAIIGRTDSDGDLAVVGGESLGLVRRNP